MVMLLVTLLGVKNADEMIDHSAGQSMQTSDDEFIGDTGVPDLDFENDIESDSSSDDFNRSMIDETEDETGGDFFPPYKRQSFVSSEDE